MTVSFVTSNARGYGSSRPVRNCALGEDDGALCCRSVPAQFNTRLLSGLSSEKVGTSISNRSPLAVTIW